MRLRRWEVVARDVQGTVIAREPRPFRRLAEREARYLTAWARDLVDRVGRSDLPPLFTATVEPRS